MLRRLKKVENLTPEDCRPFDLSGEIIKCKVFKVYDGDTVTLGFIYNKKYYKKSCRLFGIDTPELRSN